MDSIPVRDSETFSSEKKKLVTATITLSQYLSKLQNLRIKSQHCCVLLEVFGQQCCVRLHGPKNLTGFKLYVTSANKCQHCCGSMQTDATCWAQQCCIRLHGPLHKVTGKSCVSPVCCRSCCSLANLSK